LFSMAKLFKQASRAVKSELRKKEAEDLSDELLARFNEALSEVSARNVSAADLDGFIQTKIQDAKAKFRKHVNDSQWKATEEFDEVLAKLPRKMTESAAQVRARRAQQIRAEMEDLRASLLKQLSEKLSVPTDRCIPSNQEFEDHVNRACSEAMDTFRIFIDQNNLQGKRNETMKVFKEQVSNQVGIEQDNYKLACNIRDLKLQDAVDEFKLQHAGKIKKSLQQTFSAALSTLQNNEDVKGFEFLSSFKQSAERELEIASNESFSEAKLKHPLPAICPREMFVQRLDDLQISAAASS